MNNTLWLWGRAAITWLGIVALGAVVFIVVSAFFPPASDTGERSSGAWVVSTIVGVLLTWLAVAVIQRRAYENPDAPTLRIEGHVVVARPLPEVFAFMADVRNDPRWSSQIVAVEVTSPGQLRVGTTYREKVRVGSRTVTADFIVTAYDPPRHIAMRGRLGRRPTAGGYTLAPTNTGTLVTTMAETPVSILDVPFRPLFALLARRQTQALLERLRGELERQQ